MSSAKMAAILCRKRWVNCQKVSWDTINHLTYTLNEVCWCLNDPNEPMQEQPVYWPNYPWLFLVITQEGCFTNILRALQNILLKSEYFRNRLLMRISSWNFVRVHKAMLWAYVQRFSLKLSPIMRFLAVYIFARLFEELAKLDWNNTQQF